jgi:hypothetical protein
VARHGSRRRTPPSRCRDLGKTTTLIYKRVWSARSYPLRSVVVALERATSNDNRAMTLSMRVYFSTYHLWAAEFAALHAASYEREFTGRIPVFDIEQRSYVTSAVFMSVAFLEAAINEVLKDIVDNHPSYIRASDRDVQQRISEWWNQSEGQGRSPGSILDKYQKVLEFLSLPKMNKGEDPYQNTHVVVALRNELMHYKPETLGGDVVHDLEGKLRKKFDPNPLMKGSANPYFPDHCLGSSCAKWAVASVKALADTYFQTLNITPNYARTFKWPPPEEALATKTDSLN